VSAGSADPSSVRFGDDFELNPRAYQLRSAGIPLKLKPIPMELLLFLVEQRGNLVTRDQIVERIWGKGVFLDSDNSINSAVSKIRRALRDNPEAPRFVETVTGKGYRFIAPVVTIGSPIPGGIAPPAGPEGGSPEHNEPEEKKISAPVLDGLARRRTRLRWLVAGGAVLLALLGCVYVAVRSRENRAANNKIRSLAVLPLKNLSGDPGQEYLAEGMTEALIARLSRIHDLRVISRTSVMRFKDTQLSVTEVAGRLRVDAIVEGSVIREGNRIRVSAQLIRGASDEHLWSETYDRELQGVLALQADVAQTIARKVEVTVSGEERQRLTAARPVSPEVYESYLKGRFILNQSRSMADVEESLGYFTDAIRRDPTFAPAYVGQAAAYSRLSSVFIGAPPEEARARVVSAAQKALELDSEIGEAHLLLAEVRQEQWQWAEAEAEYRRALDLNPSDAAAQSWFADWLLCQGRNEEALAWVQHAREHDPLAVRGVDVGWILLHSRRYDEAIRELDGVLAVRPDDPDALLFLGFAFIANRQPADASRVLEKLASLSDRSPVAIGVLVHAYADAGRRTDALRLLAELKRRQQAGYVPAGAFVNAYLGLGEYDQAFAWLEQACKEHSNLLQYVKVHPFLDPLRKDPRFAEIVHRVGLD